MMHRLNCRIITLLTVLLFAVGGAVHGLAAADMGTDMMIMPASEAPDSGVHCDVCGGGEDMTMSSAACQALCASPTVLPHTVAGLDVIAAKHPGSALPGAPPGRAGRPNPHPPKSVILS